MHWNGCASPHVIPAKAGIQCRWIYSIGPHVGLKRLYEDDDARGVIADQAQKLRDILARLDAAGAVSVMDLPGFRLHPLKGEFKGFWAVTVRANWRVIFRFADSDALDVDLMDHH